VCVILPEIVAKKAAVLNVVVGRMRFRGILLYKPKIDPTVAPTVAKNKN
jgi:hypothetical protein